MHITFPPVQYLLISSGHDTTLLFFAAVYPLLLSVTLLYIHSVHVRML